MSWRDDPAFGKDAPPAKSVPDPDWVSRARHLTYSLRHWAVESKVARRQDRDELAGVLTQFEAAIDAGTGEEWAQKHGAAVLELASRCGIRVSGPDDVMAGAELAAVAKEVLKDEEA